MRPPPSQVAGEPPAALRQLFSIPEGLTERRGHPGRLVGGEQRGLAETLLKAGEVGEH